MIRGAHINRYGDDAAEAADGAGLIVALDHSWDSRAWLRGQRQEHGAFVLGREWTQQQPLDDASVDAYCGRIISLHDPTVYDAWQLWCETSQESRAQLADLARATIRARDRLHAAGIPVAVGSFGVGWPRVEEFDAFFPALEKGDYLLLHQYWRDNPTDASTALRHRLLWARLPEHLKRRYQGKVIIGEVGMDWGGIGLADGWRKRTDAATYGRQLRQWFAEADRDGYLMGAAVFACSQWGDWASFEVLGEESLYWWRWNVPRFVLGFKTLADIIPDVVGEPLENEHHNPANGDGLQQTTKGLMVWRKADNWTAFTDGYRTWVNGPLGLQERLNTERFDWELGSPAVHDIKEALPIAPWNLHPTRAASAISMIVVHWDGGPVALPVAYDPVAYYKTEALYHIQKDWGDGARGYGLMYQEKISRDGRTWLTRPDTDIVWAASGANPISYNVCVDANEFSPPTVEQKSVVRMRLDALRAKYGLARQRVFAHGELRAYGNSTDCAGPDLLELVETYRQG